MIAPPSTAEAALEGPRFALRFEDGRGLLALAKPLRFAWGTIEALELALGPLRFPLDLSAGASRFRTRRTRLRALRARIDLGAWLIERVPAPYRLTVLGPSDGALTLALADYYGTVALEARARFEGADLLVAIGSARSVTEGPVPPIARVIEAAGRLGLELDVERGVLRAPRLLSSLLMEALVPRGWRTPDERGARVELELLGRERVLVRTLDDGEPGAALDPAPEERARRLAPVVAALARGDRAEAERALDVLRERLGELPASLAREVGIVTGGAADGPLALCLAFRAALREARVDDAIELARALSDVEPCDAIAVEALCAAADAAGAVGSPELPSLLERAAARSPRDARVALRLIGALAERGERGALDRAIDAALIAREPGIERSELAREGAMICELADRPDEAARLWRAAADHLSHDARVLEGLARAEARAGRDDEAARLWDRAADALVAERADEEAVRALHASASLAERAGRLDVAEERLTRASELLPDEAETWAALARVRWGSGATRAAQRAEDRLLETAYASSSSAVMAALAEAAERARSAGALERARAFGTPRVQPSKGAIEPSAARVEASRAEPEEPPILPVVRAPLSERPPPREAARRAEERERAPREDDLSARAAIEDARLDDDAPLTRARRAASERDTAGLRAALNAAERAGDLDAARAIVELALETVGEGPARRALEAARDRLAGR